MDRKFLSLMLALTMIIGTFSMTYAVPSDVVGTDLEEVVERLEGLGVFTGYPDGTFRPNDKITRSEYSAVVTRAKGLKDLAENSQGETSFGDVSANFWASGYINVAEEEDLIKGKGIINGVNTFGPLLNITYEEAVTIVVRALGYEAAAQANGGWPTGYLIVADQEGLLEDVNGTMGDLASRGLVAQLTYNALEVPNMIKVGSDYVKSGTQGTEEVYLFNQLHMINQAASSGNWGSIDAGTFSDAGITGVTVANIETLKSTLETLANGDNKHWSPSDIQGVLDNTATGKKVIMVEALNATELQVKFNTELDPADAITNSPYKVSVSGVTFTGTPVLSENGKVLTLTASSAINANNAALVVEPIQTSENATITTERYTSLFSYSDTEKPGIKDIESKTNGNTANTVKVEFSEPIQSLGSVKINGTVKTSTGFTAGDSQANFTGLSLDASESHTIQFVNLRDQASNVESIINETFDVEIDTVKPEVGLSASEDKDNVIVFEFDKPVTVASATANLVNGIVKDENLNNQASATAVAINPVNGLAKKYEMAVTSPFSSLSSRDLTVLIPSGIKDALGNEVDTTNKTVILEKDTDKPEIELVRAVKDPSDNVVKLVLSTDSTLAGKASVSATALAPSLTVVDPNGVLVSSSSWLGGLSQDAITAGDKRITLSFASPAKLSGEYDITFASGLATDQADNPNNLKSKTLTVDFGEISSTGSFAITAGDLTSGGTNIYNVDYNAAVKGGNVSGSATDLSNYTLNGSSLPTGTTVTLNSTKDIATITLPGESIATSDSAAVFTINNVKRLTGETIDPFTGTVATVDNVKPVMDSAVLANDNNLIVEFSESLAATPSPADFRIKINTKTVTTTPSFVPGTGSDLGKYVVDLNTLIKNDGSQTYIDIDGNSSYGASSDIFVKAESTQTPFSMKNSPVVSSMTIETIGGATTDTATPPNSLKSGTMKTVK